MYKILNKRFLTENIVLLDVQAPWVSRAAKPGQFLIVIPDSQGERVPLTICDDDKERGTVTIVFQIVGRSTEKMAKMNVGDALHDVVGPLGRPSEWANLPKEQLRSQKFLFVAGGVGTAPVYPQVKWLHSLGVSADVIIGTKTRKTLILEDEMKAVSGNLYVCTDDGSYGFGGFVTDKLKELVEKEGRHYDEVIAIGPMVMMKNVAALTAQYHLKTTVSLNSLMVDGTGMCGSCRVNVGGKVRFTCVDGPEFDAHEVDFADAMRKQGMYRQQEIAKDTPEHHCNLTALVEDSAAAVIEPKRRVPVREQRPEVRSHNFEEVCLGYNEEEAVAEASRCIQCKKPGCVTQCPVSIKIPQFIHEVRERNFVAAAAIIAEDSALPAVCGRVCPQEVQCEGSCVLGKKGEPIAIGKLERFVADWAMQHNEELAMAKPLSNGRKVAVIGSGPSGLTCAGDLAKKGYEVTIFEALHQPGGVLSYGIPEFRLPKQKVVMHEVDNLRRLGVKIETNVIVGKSVTVDELMQAPYSFEAVFIGSGAGLPKFMNIPGETLVGVLSANEILTRSNLMKAYDAQYETPVFVGKKAVVVGGGNVAMDAARTALRLGAETHLVYRRSEVEMPARKEEIHHAKEEGIVFHLMTNPVEVLGDEQGKVRAIRCVEMALGEPDADGRRRPIAVEGSDFEIETDCVIMSLGTAPNPLIRETTPNLQTEKWGGLVADENGRTSKPGVFAGGDAVTGAATVILAMGAGRTAAAAIDEYLQNK